MGTLGLGNRCPSCSAAGTKVIYFGLPMRLCSMGRCGTVFGFWSFVSLLFPVLDFGTGAFAFTEYDGSYLPALWRWLTTDS